MRLESHTIDGNELLIIKTLTTKQKKEYLILKEFAKQKGWKLLSQRYENYITVHLFECPLGDKVLITPKNFKRNKGIKQNVCEKCAKREQVLVPGVEVPMNARQLKCYKDLKYYFSFTTD